MFPIYCTIISNKLQESAVFSAKRGQRAGLAARYEPQATKKFFGAAVFQKCCRGVGEQPTLAKQIKLHNQMQQKSKRKLEESQLPSKSEGCNERQGFRGNCDSQGKLGMCPSLAEPDSGDFPKQNVSNHKPQATEKFFDPTIFQKCWRGSGRAALIAARRQRNPCAILLARGEGGEKSDSFSRRGEQDRPTL